MRDDDATADDLGEPRVTGLYASYRGKTYRAVSYTSGRFRGSAVLRIRDDEVADFAGMVPDKPRSPEGPVAHVPLHELDGFVKVNLIGRFAGREVYVMSIDDQTVGFAANAPAGWAREHGLQGSQHSGIWGDVPRDEVEIIGEDVRDLLLTEMRRASKNL